MTVARSAGTWTDPSLLAVGGGLLMGAPHYWRPLGLLAWIAGVPWLLLVAGGRHDRPARLGWLLAGSAAFLFVAFTLAVAPAGWTGAIIGSSLYLPFPLAALWITREVRRRRDVPLAILWPAAWVTAEWGWSRVGVGAPEFALLAFSQAPLTPMIQVVDLVGAFGLSALVASSSGAVADLLLARGSAGVALRRAQRGALAIAGCVVAVIAYGLVRPGTVETRPGPRVALFQPNLPRGPVRTHEVFLRELAMVRSSLEPGDVDLAVLPENALEDFLEKPKMHADAAEVQRAIGTPLVVGAFSVHPDMRGREREALDAGRWPFTNAAFLLVDSGRIAGIGHKLHLMPWTEYVPGRELLAKLSPDLARAEERFVLDTLGFGGRAAPGPGIELLSLETSAGPARFWIPICFEASDGRLTREAARLGADFLLNITSEGKLGPQLFWNTVATCQVRAVETRRAIARATNTGITCVIGPDGELQDVLRVDGREWGVEGVLEAVVPIASGPPTVAILLGDGVPAALAVLAAGLLAGSILRPRPPEPAA